MYASVTGMVLPGSWNSDRTARASTFATLTTGMLVSSACASALIPVPVSGAWKVSRNEQIATTASKARAAERSGPQGVTFRFGRFLHRGRFFVPRSHAWFLGPHGSWSSSSISSSWSTGGFLRRKLYMIGTKNNVVNVATRKPPITARPSGAFCSPAFTQAERHRQHADDHSERGHDHGADARKAGRQRRFASRLLPSARSSLAKVTSRMLLAVATPMHMMAPISDGTFKVVCVIKSIHRIPASAPGSAIRMMNGSSQDWKVDHHQAGKPAEWQRRCRLPSA